MKLPLLKTCLAFLLILPGTFAHAQEVALPVRSDSISGYLERMTGRIPDREKREVSRELESLLTGILGKDSSFFFSFRQVYNLGVLMAPDSLFRIFQWNVPFADGTHAYHAIIQESPGEGRGRLFHLEGASGRVKQKGMEMLDTANWYGCLYFDIIAAKNDSLRYYVLLGADMNNLFTSLRIVDALWFDTRGMPVFGLPVFQTETEWQNRLVFEYAARAGMSLRYHPEKEMVVYDHLSPMDPAYQGQYQFYGPDFSYDALVQREGRWFLQKDVDARNR